MTSMKQTAELPQEPDLKKRKVISKEVYRKRLEANAAKLARAFNSQQDSREASTSYEVKTNNTDKCLR